MNRVTQCRRLVQFFLRALRSDFGSGGYDTGCPGKVRRGSFRCGATTWQIDARPIYGVAFGGKNRRLAITVSGNGYIVGANSMKVESQVFPESLRLLADYLCFPVWSDDKGDIDPSTLPISKKLANELLEWAHIYDTTLDQNYPPDSHFATAEEKRKFTEKGHELKIRLQQELGNNYEVIYVIPRLPSPPPPPCPRIE